MSGLEKMKGRILDEAKALAESKIADARSQAAEILETAKAEAEKTAAGISRKSDMDAANYKERIASSIDLQERTKLLAAKQEIIAEVLDKSYKKMKTMETEEYFAALLRMLRKYILPQKGQIYFSAADLERMPSSFQKEIAQIAQAQGGSLVVSGEREDIESGFVLAYGGIEENCTLKAMFDAKRDELSDQIYQLLFV